MKVEVDVLGSPSLTSLRVSVDIKLATLNLEPIPCTEQFSSCSQCFLSTLNSDPTVAAVLFCCVAQCPGMSVGILGTS